MKKILNHIEEYLICIVFMFMLGLTFVNVIFRYFLTSSLSFTEEFTCALFVLLCVLGTAVAAKHQAHLGLSVLTELLSERGRQFAAAAANILGVVFSLILMITGIQMAYTEYVLKQLTIALQWPEWIYGSFLPIGAAFMAIRFGQATVACLKKAREVQ